MAIQDASGITEPCFVRDFSTAPSFDEVKDVINESFKKEFEKGVAPDETLNPNTVIQNSINGLQAFVQSIVPSTKIPEAVETYMIKKIDHPLIEAVAGTADYLGHGVIADIKTSAKSPTLKHYVLQQATYKMLAEYNGFPIKQNLIQGIIKTEKTKVYAKIYAMTDINVPQVDFILENLKTRLKILFESGADMMDFNNPTVQALFGGNAGWNLCNPKYCNFYASCKFVHGDKPMFEAQPSGFPPFNLQSPNPTPFQAEPSGFPPFNIQPKVQDTNPFQPQVK